MQCVNYWIEQKLKYWVNVKYMIIKFRTQEPSGRLMYIQLKTSQGLATSFVEFLVFNGILQVTASFGLGMLLSPWNKWIHPL